MLWIMYMIDEMLLKQKWEVGDEWKEEVHEFTVGGGGPDHGQDQIGPILIVQDDVRHGNGPVRLVRKWSRDDPDEIQTQTSALSRSRSRENSELTQACRDLGHPPTQNRL